MLAVSTALVLATLVFGLYPETPAEKATTVAPNQPTVQLATIEYEGKVRPVTPDQTRALLLNFIDKKTD